MKYKKLLTSKVFWSGISSIGLGVGLLINGDAELGVQNITGGITAIVGLITVIYKVAII